MRRGATLLALLALLATGCRDEPTLEQQIISAVTEMERYAEEGLRADFMSMVHEDFLGQDGTLNRDSFRLYMIMQWNEHQRLYAQLFPIRVSSLGEGQARAAFRALITGGRGLVPDSGELFEISTFWVHADGDWKLLKADWDPVLGEEIF
ncbi:MAG: hypothetical protein GWM87_11445 [Xanthomonadales bacterium]|nr:hypothetical protein [Xanthomonadales bacterium]NIX13479.1 hypothetical protein [Xanthomonadales bacterium]